eukprot:10472632-Karenia_brevis.AAC.1
MATILSTSACEGSSLPTMFNPDNLDLTSSSLACLSAPGSFLGLDSSSSPDARLCASAATIA